MDFLQYDLKTVKDATDDFSTANKLGQGGFGIVYKVIEWKLNNLLTVAFCPIRIDEF